MDAKEINELSESIASIILLRFDERYAPKSMAAKHERILTGSNGDAGLPELVRTNTKDISTNRTSIRRIYAVVGTIVGAIGLEMFSQLLDWLRELL